MVLPTCAENAVNFNQTTNLVNSLTEK